MADWIIYTENIEKAIADLVSVSPDRWDSDNETFEAKLGPISLIRDGSKAMALVGSDTAESDVELNAVVKRGNIQILGVFDQGAFVPVDRPALAIFKAMRPVTHKATFPDGRVVEVDLPEQFTAFS